MRQQELNYLKGILEEQLEKKQQLLDSIERIFSPKSLKEEFGELSSYDNHLADLGSETFLVEQNYSIKDNQKRQIQQIEDALTRIKNGNYGICEMCGQEISFQRLKVVPDTRLCLQCEHNRQDKKQHNR